MENNGLGHSGLRGSDFIDTHIVIFFKWQIWISVHLLVSDLNNKPIEGIAFFFNQDRILSDVNSTASDPVIWKW